MNILRYVGDSADLSEAYRSFLSAPDTAVISTLQPNPNVSMSFRRDGSPLQVSLPPVARDFLDLAATVYIADELIARDQSPDQWTRTFDLVVPVEDTRLWEAESETLGKALGDLSGDRWNLQWLRRGSLPSLGRHRRRLPKGFDAVCTFSGGIDSFLGAYGLLQQGRRVLLIGHQAEGITASAQTDLAVFLRMKFPGAVSLIQCRVARSLVKVPLKRLPPKCETSHRPRSFLFLGLAVVIARAAEISEIVIPENGLIAINSPLQRSRLGTLSTRTTHPKYLSLFANVTSGLRLHKGCVANPFLYKSKTDMLQELDPKLVHAVGRTVSCAHVGSLRWTKTSVRHCGTCVPCIYRRVAMMGTPAYDEERYLHDVFTSLGALSPYAQSDFRALVAFAKRIVSMSSFERQMLVVAHGSFPPEIGVRLGTSGSEDYTPWSLMLLRWSEDFLKKVKNSGSQETRRIVGV